ncbi:MAG TPA: magnesium/cobalt transporter CorA [Phototrophicaceae bacterium]|nr:magnesium/cobalt transporter CorA [Phototrophicaceae bacterium]
MDIYSFDLAGLHPVAAPELAALRSSNTVIWIDVPVPSEVDLNRLQTEFGFHPLAMEDARNEHQRPKIEEYEDHVFIITNHAAYEDNRITFHEIDIFLGRNYIVTIHHHSKEMMDEVRGRMTQKDRFRHFSSEYLLYVLMDTIVDGYFPLLDRLDTEIEMISERVLDRAEKQLLVRLFELKRMLNEAWYVVGQERDMFGILTLREGDIFTHHDVLEYYLRDVSDHLIRIGDIISVKREDLKNIADLYVSSTSNQLNQVVNRLAIITILIGILTVISGFYGMNFTHTWPPLDAEWGILFAIALMGGLSAGALIIFKWLKLY